MTSPPPKVASTAPPAPPASSRSEFIFYMGVCLCITGAWLAILMTYFHKAWDFTQFYLVSQTSFSQIYDQSVIHELGQRLLAPLGITYYPPYVRPAIGAVLVRPLGWFGYWTAFGIFTSAQLIAFEAILWLSVRHFGVRAGALAGAAFFYPATMGIVTGQDIVVVTLIAVSGLLLLRDGKTMAGGLLLGLTTYKYNLFLFVPVLLAVRRSWRGLAGWIISAAAMAFISVMLAPARAYIELVLSIRKYTIGFSPVDMISVRGPLSALGIPLYPLAALLITSAAIYAMRRLPLEQAFYAGQVAAILAGFHVNWYDAASLLTMLLWLVAPSSPMPRTSLNVAGRTAAMLLLLGTPLWPFAHFFAVGLMAVIFAMFCATATGRVPLPSDGGAVFSEGTLLERWNN